MDKVRAKIGTSRAEFDVALSFAGEDRKYVEDVASCLRELGIRVFYDRYEKVTLWGKDLYTHLEEVYSKRSRYVVMFISHDYKRRLWTNHERRSAQARAFQENREFILPARFDLTDIPGVLPTTGYVDLKTTTPSELANLIRLKIGPVYRHEYFPSLPDLLFAKMNVRSKAQKCVVAELALHYFEMAKLMTFEERILIAEACRHTCPCGPPDNVHLRLDYLARLLKLGEREIQAMGARLDCLSVRMSVRSRREHNTRFPILTIKFLPLLEDVPGELGSHVMFSIHECIFDSLCPRCGMEALERLDFSQLSTRTCHEDGMHDMKRRAKKSTRS